MWCLAPSHPDWSEYRSWTVHILGSGWPYWGASTHLFLEHDLESHWGGVWSGGGHKQVGMRWSCLSHPPSSTPLSSPPASGTIRYCLSCLSLNWWRVGIRTKGVERCCLPVGLGSHIPTLLHLPSTRRRGELAQLEAFVARTIKGQTKHKGCGRSCRGLHSGSHSA